MKRWKYLLALLVLPFVLAVGASYQRDKPIATFLSTPQVAWENAGTLTADLTTLAVGARDWSAVWTDIVDANSIKYEVPNWASGIEVRFQTTADADATVVELWVAPQNVMADRSTEESFTLGVILTLTGGKQVGPNSNVFVDTIVPTATTGVLSGYETVDSAADRMCIWRVDLRGWKYITGIATTLQGSSTLYCDIRWY